MKVSITVEAEFEVEFDENSDEFKLMFNNYNKHFQECEHKEFAELLAVHIARNGSNEEMEGVGLIKIDGEAQEEIDHPVNVNILNGTDLNGMVDFSVGYSGIV